MKYTKKIPSIKEQGIWNALAGSLCALEAVIMELVAAHFLGIDFVGELTIAFALGNLFRTIGLWGTRSYQLSDLKYEFSFIDYKKARIINLLLMLISVFAYILYLIIFRDTSVHKIIVISIIEIVYFIECYEDLIAGEYQRRGRLDIGSKLLIIRWGSLLISYSFFAFLFRSLVFALIISLLISTILFILVLNFYFGVPQNNSLENNKDNKKFFSDNVFKLLRLTFPLFAITFLTFFLNNVAKYSLDYYYSEMIQACFGYITLSIFAVEMVSGFIYQPTLTSLTEKWLKKDIKHFIAIILFQFLVILLLIFICFIAGWFVGVPILSLSNYKFDLIINIFAGGMMSFSVYATHLLTIMRKQNTLLVIYGITNILGGIFIWELTKNHEIRGGSLGNLIIFSIQAIEMYIVIIISIIKYKNSN